METISLIFNKTTEQWDFMEGCDPIGVVNTDLALQSFHKLMDLGYWYDKTEPEGFIHYKFYI